MTRQSTLRVYPDADLLDGLGGTSRRGGGMLPGGVRVTVAVERRLGLYIEALSRLVREVDPEVEVEVCFDQIRCSGATRRAVYLSARADDPLWMHEALEQAYEVAHGLRPMPGGAS